VIRWDAAKVGITGREVEKLLYDTEPRIVLGAASGDRRGNAPSSITIMPYMMQPEDHRIVAQRLHAVLSSPPRTAEPQKPSGPMANVDGQWRLHIKYLSGSSDHHLTFEQKEGQLVGTHRGDVIVGDLRGTVEGPEVRFRSRCRYEGTMLSYDFTGTQQGDRLGGTVDMGEYGKAEWTAERHKYAG
jgi:L-seryl-tRNA(Ser) seleniumtransferase